MRYLPDDFVFPERWWDVRGHAAADESRRNALRRELAIEVTEGHQLWGLDATAIASCGHCDDVIFRVGDERFAVVHLVWQGPQRPPWPDTLVIERWEDVAALVLMHEEM